MSHPGERTEPPRRAWIVQKLEVIEASAGTGFGGGLCIFAFAIALACMISPFVKGSALHSPVAKGFTVAAGCFALIAGIVNLRVTGWMKDLADVPGEPMPLRVLHSLRFEPRWIRRALPPVCVFNIALLWWTVYGIIDFNWLRKEGGGRVVTAAEIAIQLMLCYASNAYLIFLLDGLGVSKPRLARLWHFRFAFDLLVGLMLWAILGDRMR